MLSMRNSLRHSPEMRIIELCGYAPTLEYKESGGDMVSTWVAKLRVHAEAQNTS